MESRGLWMDLATFKVYPDGKRTRSPVCQKNMTCFVVVVPDAKKRRSDGGRVA